MYETEVLTALATGFTNAAGFPQMVRTIRTRSTRDLSLRFTIMLVIGLSFWEIYATWTHQPIFMLGNGFGLTTWSIVLAIKLKNRRKDEQGPPPIVGTDGGPPLVGMWHPYSPISPNCPWPPMFGYRFITSGGFVDG